MKNHKLFLLITFFPLISFAQIKLKGKITDETNLPIQFVTIQTNTNKNTITNENGEFELNVASLPVQLNISHVSYAAVQIKKTDDSAIALKLKQLTVTLKEVAIGNYALTLMRNAFEKAKENYQSPNYAKAFLRQIAFDGERPTYLNELYFNADWRNYGLIKWNPLEARHLKDKSSISYTNMSFFTLAFSGFLFNDVHAKPLSPKLDSLYTFKLKGTYKLGDKEIAIISCKPKVKFTKIYFEGDYLVNTEDYTILKIEGQINNFKMNTSGPVGIRNKAINFMAQYKIDENGKNVLDFSTFNVTSKLTVLGFGAKTLTFASTLYIVDYSKDFNKNLKDLSAKTNDINTIKEINYNPTFWAENPTIKRTAREDESIKILEAAPQPGKK